MDIQMHWMVEGANQKLHNRMQEVNLIRNVHRKEVAQIVPNLIQVLDCTSMFNSILKDHFLFINFIKSFNRDDVTSSSLDQPDELVNASTSTAGQRPGTSQDSSPASSDDESSRDLEPNLSATLTAEIMQQLTDAERKRQEIINGK